MPRSERLSGAFRANLDRSVGVVPGKPRGRPTFSGALQNGNEPDTLGARLAGAPRMNYMCPMIASPNSLHFTSFAPSICRAKS